MSFEVLFSIHPCTGLNATHLKKHLRSLMCLSSGWEVVGVFFEPFEMCFARLLGHDWDPFRGALGGVLESFERFLEENTNAKSFRKQL